MRTSLSSSTALSRSNFAAVRLAIEYVASAEIKVERRAVRRHRPGQLRELAAGISRTGFNVPLIVDEKLSLVCGHARLEAAKLVGLTPLPITRLSHLTEEQLRLFAMFDNRIYEQGEWDESALALEFEELRLSDPAIEITDSGFAIAEIDQMIGVSKTAALSDLDDAPLPVRGPAVTQLGDLWLCGRHRVICGDSTNPAVIATLVDGNPIRQMITDPPFDLPTKAFSSTGRFEDFAMGAGEMGPARFTDFLTSFINAAKPTLLDGAVVYAFMDHRHIGQLLAAAERAELTYLNMLVWVKGLAGQGSFYRSGHELVGVFRYGEGPARNNIQLGKHGRHRSNVLSYPGVRGKGGGGAKALAMHPTVKNLAMIADLMLDASAPGEAILDSFGGSGTTLIAAEKVDRVAFLCDLSPHYVDVAVRRFEALGGEAARLAATGQTFAEVTAARAVEAEEA